MLMMQAFRSPSVVARCCSELEIADTSPSVHCPNQGPMFQVDSCDVQQGQNFVNSLRRDEPRSTSHVFSGATDHQIVLAKFDTPTATRAVRSSGMDCHHHQEERESTSLSRSILDCNSSSARADVLCNDFGPRGNNVGTNILDTHSQNWKTSRVTAPEIECYNEADISAACLLLEMSTTSYSSGDIAGEEHSQEQPCSCIRVPDTCDHVSPALLPVRELSPLVGAQNSGLPRATDDELIGTVQETRLGWEETYSSTPRSLRIELRTLGKKRIKPRKDEREVKVFAMNQEVLTPDTKFDILDRPTRKRHYKSLRVLLGIK